MRKKVVIAIVLGVVAVAALGFAFLRVVPNAQVVGTLPEQDVAEIRQTVNREIWRRAWPEFSWRSLKRLPSNLAYSTSAHIERINAESKPFVMVMVGKEEPGASNAAPSTHLIYFMKQGTNGWQILSVSPIYGTLKQSNPDGMSPFHPSPDSMERERVR